MKNCLSIIFIRCIRVRVRFFSAFHREYQTGQGTCGADDAGSHGKTCLLPVIADKGCRAGKDKADQRKAEQEAAKQGKANQDKGKPDNDKQDKAKPDNPDSKQDKPDQKKGNPD